MGRAAAIAFAREGADVAINYLPAEEPDAKEVVALIRQAGRKAVALPGDIREETFCRKLVEDAVARLDGLDILVNNAGRQISRDSILEITSEQFDETFKTNIYANFWISKAAIPHMKRGSAIINANDRKTRLACVPQESFDFLGYTIGRFDGRHGNAFLGTEPSRKSLHRIIERIHGETTPRWNLDSTGNRVAELNALLRGWSGYFNQGRVIRDYRVIQQYTDQRLAAMADTTARQARNRIPPALE